ncbi:hypothetical protein [Facklamia hominis]|uniref:Uncharacterized protein n=1 Tax=Facklamia hominis CCUG 36813 TaxID=883111 RepID=K1LSL2_9LACT|nr:hypothetical protein [Facklamia hominis]EKB55087.1 hypothetical protein HMPREF9706_01277 [Facklamia hominis CCUG 36813]
MKEKGHEIKHGKHITFRSENQQRFTRAKTIGENYSESSIKNRIQNKAKEIGVIVNSKAKDSKAYEHWADKHNLNTAANRMLQIHDKGFESIAEMKRAMSSLSYKMNKLRKEFDKKNFEQKLIKEIAKSLQTCINKKFHYDGYKKNP